MQRAAADSEGGLVGGGCGRKGREGGEGQEGDAIGGEGACRSGRGRHGRRWRGRGQARAATPEEQGDGLGGGRGACCRKGAAAARGVQRKGWEWGEVGGMRTTGQGDRDKVKVGSRRGAGGWVTGCSEAGKTE